MESDDDVCFSEVHISSNNTTNNSRNKNKSNHTAHTTTAKKNAHQAIKVPKKSIHIPEKVIGCREVVYNVLSKLAIEFFSQEKNNHEDEIVYIKGQPTKKVEKDSYKLVNPDFEGKIIYVNLLGQPHREESNGPAIIYPNGSNVYCYYGRKSRDENSGPAETIINADGSNIQKYYEYDVLCRSKGPAVIHSNGSYEYYNNGQLHNENGPASHMLITGTNKFEDEYWLHGKKLSTLQFKMVNLRNKLFKNTNESKNKI